MEKFAQNLRENSNEEAEQIEKPLLNGAEKHEMAMRVAAHVYHSLYKLFKGL
jgi:hypothetical protein